MARLILVAVLACAPTAQDPQWRVPQAEMGVPVEEIPPTPPSYEEDPRFLPAYDVQVLVVDARRGMPVLVKMEVFGVPMPTYDWWLGIRTRGLPLNTIIRFSAPGYRSQTRSLTRGVHVIEMVRLGKV